MQRRSIRSLFWLALALPLGALGATPATGVLTATSGPITYSAGPFLAANPTPVPEVDAGPECNNPAQPCDDFALSVTLPAGYKSTHPNASVKVSMSWVDTGTGKSDYDLYVYDGSVIGTDGSQTANYQSASGANPEVASVAPVFDGAKTYTIKVVPYTPSAETISVRIELLDGVGGAAGSFGGADPVQPGVPRYQNFYAPHGSSAEPGNGEFNIGFNPKSHRIMAMNSGPIWRLTPPEVVDPGKPESCEALWEDKSSTVADVGLDPILWTDQKSGRTFASNSTVGANAVYAYSDNDGDLWVPIGVGPPNGGADHETIATGPFPTALSLLATPLNQGQFTVYCSQDIVGPAMCQTSLDLGTTWGPGVPAYTGNGAQGCGGLHGHAHIAPNGTAWLPVNQCNGHQGGVTSTDAGITWNEFAVPGAISQNEGADPSIALDADSTAYYCYVNNEPVAVGAAPEGHVHVKVSRDGGLTWINDVDIGATHGILNAVHTEAVGGSSGRAACGFIGTNVAGDYQSTSFQGVWYPFIATTYDGGAHWVTVNAAPNDPVQRASGVWQQGGSHLDRNLLDFNEVTVDDKGRVLYGYSDGCVSDGCIAGTAANDFTAHMRVARQSGGRGLFAQFDNAEPVAPKRACLSGARDSSGSTLAWKAPDAGGAAISGYQILRGTSAGQEAPIGSTIGTKTSFDDTTADPRQGNYYYVVKAISAAGTGLSSNELVLPKGADLPNESACDLPGVTRVTDASGDTSPLTGIVNGGPATPAGPGMDLKALHVAQPYAADGNVKLIFTLDTDPGASPQPANTSWYVSMRIADPAPATTFRYKAVRMTWNGSSPTFESYTPSASNAGTVDGRFVTAGSQKPASGSYAEPYDKVVISASLADLGLNPGDTITGFVAAVSYSAVAISGQFDAMPDSLGYSGNEVVNSNQLCRPNAAPIAALAASPLSGTSPLTVHFVGAGSDGDTAAPADTIASYTFDFGDGSAPVTQSTASVDHTYSGAFSYNASLVVKDSRGKPSENYAGQNITVTAPTTPDLTITKTHNGDFVQGQLGATYAITVKNVGNAPTAGQVTATDALPSGLTANGMSGAGWSCTAKPTARCTRSDALAPGASYPPITLTVSVGKKAAGSLVNTATVQGGGDDSNANNTAHDPTNVRAR